MTKVTIDPGVCGNVAKVEAVSEDGMEAAIRVESGCAGVNGMMEELGGIFDAYELCLKKPGENALYEYAAENFPMHAGCPVLAGIVKCVEAECKLALPRDVSIRFEEG